MDLRQLRHFVAIVDRGGFARAAAHCHVSQPAISASIAQLEARLGVPLLERGSFGARPTAAGRTFYDRAVLILSEVRRAGEEIAAVREGEGGSVAIGIGPLFEHMIMPTVIADFVRRRPKINLSVAVGLTTELFARLAQGELDLTISSPPGAIELPGDLDVDVLQATHDVVVASADHPLWRTDDHSLAALARYRWIVSARVGEVSRGFFQEFATAGVVPPQTLVRTDSIPVLRMLVREQQFLCIVSPHFAEPLFGETVGTRDSRLRIVPSKHFAAPRQVCMAVRSSSLLTKPAQEMAESVRVACRSSLGQG